MSKGLRDDLARLSHLAEVHAGEDFSAECHALIDRVASHLSSAEDLPPAAAAMLGLTTAAASRNNVGAVVRQLGILLSISPGTT